MSKTHIDLCEVCAQLERAGWELLRRGYVAPLRFTLAHQGGPLDCIQEPSCTAVAVPVEVRFVDAENRGASATIDAQGMALRVGQELERT